MKKKVTVLGAGGQMGQWFTKYFADKDFAFFDFARNLFCDIAKLNKRTEFIYNLII